MSLKKFSPLYWWRKLRAALPASVTGRSRRAQSVPVSRGRTARINDVLRSESALPGQGPGHVPGQGMLGWPTAFEQLQRELLHWFNDAGRAWPSMRALFDPAPVRSDALALAAYSGVALSEDGESYLVSMEVPGIELDDLSVSVQGDTLVVEGHAGQTCEYSDGNGYRLLRRVGTISRRVQLPPDANPGRVDASINDGELTVVIARR